MSRILDTFPRFLECWRGWRDLSAAERIEGWAEEYMSRWPALLRKQLDDYSSMTMDWRQVAAERVFPFLEERLEQMKRAHSLLPKVIEHVHEAAERAFEMELDIRYVIYVGIGGGAGWVTELAGSQAVLLGLEMAAECGWTDRDSLSGLVAHELGHAVHGTMRGDPSLSGDDGPYWRLYTEGFAQRCEHIVLGRDTWHVGRRVNPPEWLCWCGDNRSWLAGRFLQAAEDGGDVRDFFGSWMDIEGMRHCGHYLGHEAVLELERTSGIRNVALLEDVRPALARVLEDFITAG